MRYISFEAYYNFESRQKSRIPIFTYRGNMTPISDLAIYNTNKIYDV